MNVVIEGLPLTADVYYDEPHRYELSNGNVLYAQTDGTYRLITRSGSKTLKADQVSIDSEGRKKELQSSRVYANLQKELLNSKSKSAKYIKRSTQKMPIKLPSKVLNRADYALERSTRESTEPVVTYQGTNRQLSINGFLCKELVGAKMDRAIVFAPEKTKNGTTITVLIFDSGSPSPTAKKLIGNNNAKEFGWALGTNPGLEKREESGKAPSAAWVSLGKLMTESGLLVKADEKVVWKNDAVTYDGEANAFMITLEKGDKQAVVKRDKTAEGEKSQEKQEKQEEEV